MKLTLKSVASIELPAGKADHTVFDDDTGLGLRLRAGGAKTWIYRYRVGRKQRSLTLGSAKAVPLAVAKETAGRLQAKVRLGGDPALDKQAARAVSDNLVGALIDQYLDARQGEWRASSLRQFRLHLLDYAKPLHAQPITTVSQRNVAKLLENIAKTSGKVSSNRVRASLAALFSWVIRQGIPLPAGNVVSYTAPCKEKSRERVLSRAEIRAIWHALPGDDDYSAIIKLLLLTGQRAAEIGSLRFDEIRDDCIELPSSRTKNARPHTVPLSAPAKAILDKHSILGRVHVFGRDDSHGFRGWGVCKQRLDARIGLNEPWVVHDLRRTCATGMIDLSILPHAVEAVLNHVSGHRRGVAGVYNRAAYDKEKREALDTWAQHVLGIVR